MISDHATHQFAGLPSHYDALPDYLLIYLNIAGETRSMD